MRFNQLVKLARSWRRIGKLHAARIGLPESPHAFLQI
jgi:hypothetical protein